MESSPEPVAVLGLGRMGTALATALLAAGHEVTVWNRTPAKAGPLLDRGARLAASPAEVSGVVIACLSTYSAQEPVLTQLTGAGVLVNLTSGTPSDARRCAAAQGISYLDGVIMAVPQAIGSPGASLLYGGDESAFTEHRGLLETLGTATFLGSDAGLPALYDLALLGLMWSAFGGYLHALALVGTESVAPTSFAPLATSWLSAVQRSFPAMAAAVESGDYTTEVSSVDINALGLRHLVETSRAQGIGSSVPLALKELFERAEAAGHGAHGPASVIEVIR